ncbi:hypothetical protein [Sphingomonas nostoxanthinifaciens]|uniref:hypothetical protein n=1 Tax=Sphingomonas nostoxanthinifaciens TaxID=2872652 RepID=UPI001CC1CBA3|nr:hypothetical protein [Sphingomonas nostoxanthinifaciens]UAK23061.1 hypothetical protein K8P63_11545 [Sphingomonas nostoxanthinifaciens]
MVRSISGKGAGSKQFARAAWPLRSRPRRSTGFGFRRRQRELGNSPAGRSLFGSPWFYAGLIGSVLVWAGFLALIV